MIALATLILYLMYAKVGFLFRIYWQLPPPPPTNQLSSLAILKASLEQGLVFPQLVYS